MTKIKTTFKAIRSTYNNILSVGYCGLQSLLTYETPFAYSAGIYGWSCDYYDVNGLIISTGYSPIGKKVNYDIVNEYELKAEKIRGNYDLKYDERRQAIENLLTEFAEKVLDNFNN